MSRSTRTTGALANAIAHAVGRVRETQAPLDAHWKRANLEYMLEDAEKVWGPQVGEMFAWLKDAPNKPAWLVQLLDKGVEPDHQWESIYQLIGLLIGLVTGVFSLGQIELVQLMNDIKSKYAYLPVSPADAADAVVRGHMDMADGQRYAAMSQIGETEFGFLYAISGEPPGPMQLAEAYRRGYIDQPTFEAGIRQSRIRDEWIPTMLALRFAPPSPSDAIRAVIRDRLTTEQGKAYAGEGGLSPENFDWVLAATGNPPALGEAFQMLHRGIIGIADVDQIIRESNTMNKYVDKLDQLQTPIPGLLYIRLLVAANAVPDSQAIEWILHLGYDQQVAAGIVSAAHKAKTATAHALTEANILKLYLDRAVDRAQATTLLHDLGYVDADIGMLLDLQDHAAEIKERDHLISKVHAQYISHHITRSVASNDLDAVQMPTAQRDSLLSMWDIELASEVRLLTPAQLLKANKASPQVLDDTTCQARLMQLGYTQADADLLITIDGSGTPPGA